MSIISVQFLLFSFMTAALYFLLPMKCRPWWLLITSIFFYSTFSLSHFLYLGITVISTFFASHLAHRAMENGNRKKSLMFTCGAVALNLGILIAVKFLGSTVSLLGLILRIQVPEIRIPAALGIAFYTLQSVSYCVDVYRGKHPPEQHFWKYLLYMLYFPIILQGPISRYQQLSHQLATPNRFSFDRMKAGCSLMLWGMFQKMVIADRAALLVNQVFGNHTEYSGFAIVIAVALYSIQLYSDFAGCVDISRGFSQILGIELPRNFNAPYFADSIQDFWRRWHISLSSWFRDYLYIPLGGSRKGIARKYLNVMIVFLASGLWHGVGFQFIVWGALQGLFQICGALTLSFRDRLYAAVHIRKDGIFRRFFKILTTFLLTNLSWLFFRADSVQTALEMLLSAFTRLHLGFLVDGSLFKMGLDAKDWAVLLPAIVLLFVVNLLQQTGSVRERLERHSFWIRYPIYIAAVLAILVFGVYGPGFDQSQFLYMQF